MKNSIRYLLLMGLACSLPAILFGCASANPRFYGDKWAEVRSEVDKECGGLVYYSPEESIAWMESTKSSALKQCRTYYPTSGIQLTSCMQEYYRRTIRPLAYSQDAFDAMQERQLIATRELDTGEIDKAQFDVKAKKAHEDYASISAALRKNSAFAWAMCREDVIRGIIPSDFGYWPQLNQHLIDVASTARKGDEVKLPNEDIRLLYEQLWLDFSNSSISEYKRRTAEAERKNAQQMAAFGAALGAASQASHGYSQPNLSGKTGFYVREATSGFNKVCYYNALGDVYTLNVSSTSLCPLTADF